MSDEFRKASDAAREFAEAGDIIRIVTHNDADGLSAGAILHKSFLREGCAVHTTSVKQMDESVILELSKEAPKVLILADLGSGQLDSIEKNLLRRSFVVVLDHHQPKKLEHEKLIHVNPHNYGVDGAREVSGSGMAYFFSRALSEKNLDLADLGIVGAVGDIQDESELRGLNRDILDDGIKVGVVRAEKDLRIFGRQTRPLYKAIEFTTEPFIPGLSGSESACIQFLNELAIPVKKDGEFTMLADLSSEERQKLTTALILKMIEHKVPPKFAESIVGEVYTLLKESKRTPLRDAKEYATLLNGCGKHDKAGVGLAVCIGERGALYEKSLGTLKEHKGYLSSCYAWLSKNSERIKESEELYYFHTSNEIDENVIGTVASMALNSMLLESVKPILAFAESEDGSIKVSSRGTRDLVESGLNLGKVMMYASEKVGGEGGGHDIAAGAKIAKGMEENFLEHAKAAIRRQMKGEGKGEV